MMIRITARQLRCSIAALVVIEHDRPVLAMGEKSRLIPDIGELKSLLENTQGGIPKPWRGQKIVYFEIPDNLRTRQLNECLRYGIADVLSWNSGRKGRIDILDSAAAIAYADILLPLPPGGRSHYHRMTDEEYGGIDNMEGTNEK